MGVEFDLDNGKLMQIECQFLKKVGNVTMYYVHYLVIYLVCLFLKNISKLFCVSSSARRKEHIQRLIAIRLQASDAAMPFVSAAMPVEL